MQLENLLYAGAQVAHNFGAAAVVGLPIAALWFKPEAPTLRKVVSLTLLAWLTQIASGAGFGSVSYFVVGALPEIHNLAIAALIIKIVCAMLATFLVSLQLLERAKMFSDRTILASLAALGSTALACAAVLRWFS